jgi:hypothetical protein
MKEALGMSAEIADPRKPQKPGFSTWIENGVWYQAPTVDPAKFGPHDYHKKWPQITMCKCGCRMGSESSSGPVDPFGACPSNPKQVIKDEILQKIAKAPEKKDTSIFRFELHTATAQEAIAPWACGEHGKYFRCGLCGRKLHEGSAFLILYTNDMPLAGGNPILCDECVYRNGYDREQCRQAWAERCAEARSDKFWWFNVRR